MIFDKVAHINRFINKETADSIISDYNQICLEENFKDKIEIAEGVTRRRVEMMSKLGGGEIEAHDQHVDVQIMIKGNETLEVIDRNDLKEKSSNNLTDFILFEENPARVSSFVPLKRDFALILFPYDAHKTQISANNKEEMFLKAVYKVHISKI